MPRIFAIADLHLGGNMGKTMDKFGAHWKDHAQQIQANCQRLVNDDDILLLPGDLSWATRRRDAEEDLAYMAALPGTKICIKGNHDYWWESDKRITYPGLLSPPILLSDGVTEGAIGIAGTRGWQEPEVGSETEVTDHRTFTREKTRLRQNLSRIADCPIKIAMLHYPPQPFMPILKEFGIQKVVYGHIHLGSFPEDEAMAVFDEDIEGIRCWCVASDRMNFSPQLILTY
jgi:uncharacterized protein